MRVIVAGSRDFDDYELIKKTMESLNLNPTEIVSGHALGADRLGEKYAMENSIPVKLFIPDWNKDPKGAGITRNREMAKYADYLVAFSHYTPGTENMIEQMEAFGKPMHVLRVRR